MMKLSMVFCQVRGYWAVYPAARLPAVEGCSQGPCLAPQPKEGWRPCPRSQLARPTGHELSTQMWSGEETASWPRAQTPNPRQP